MKAEITKSKPQREYAIDVPASKVRKVAKAVLGYGNRQKLATASGVNTTTINNLIRDKRATKSNLNKLLTAIDSLTETTAA